MDMPVCPSMCTCLHDHAVYAMQKMADAIKVPEHSIASATFSCAYTAMNMHVRAHWEDGGDCSEIFCMSWQMMAP